MISTLEALYRGEELSADAACRVMSDVVDGSVPDAQVAAFLSAYRLRLPTAAELTGFRTALLARASSIALDAEDALDMVGTGGDGKDTFNITTLSALTVAAAGYRVVKHGNGSASSKHGSSDTLRNVGFSFRQNQDQLRRQLDAANITFLHAPLFHPALGKVAPLRRALGVGTVFNLLGPLLNPAQPGYNYIGVADARTQGLYADVFAAQGKTYNVVHSNDGYDEATLTGPVRCYTTVGRTTLQARDFHLPPTNATEIESRPDAPGQFLTILKGHGSDAETNTVAANAGLAIQLRRGQQHALVDCVAQARETLLSGLAFSNFQTLCAA